MIDTQDLQQQVLDDFAFHLGYYRDNKTGGYKQDLFHICHSPFRLLNYNTMVLLYNHASQVRSVSGSDPQVLEYCSAYLRVKFKRLGNIISIIKEACRTDTPIETIYLQYAKKKRKVLCHKHQIKFSSCKAGQTMKEDFEKEHYPGE